MEETTRWQDLASAAMLGQWPPHLLAPDEDRVYALGVALNAAADKIAYLESVEDQNAALEEENDFLKSDILDLKETLKKIREMTHIPGVADVQD